MTMNTISPTKAPLSVNQKVLGQTRFTQEQAFKDLCYKSQLWGLVRGVPHEVFIPAALINDICAQYNVFNEMKYNTGPTAQSFRFYWNKWVAGKEYDGYIAPFLVSDTYPKLMVRPDTMYSVPANDVARKIKNDGVKGMMFCLEELPEQEQTALVKEFIFNFVSSHKSKQCALDMVKRLEKG